MTTLPRLLLPVLLWLAACSAAVAPRGAAPEPAAPTAAAPQAEAQAEALCACTDEDCARPIMTALFVRQLELTEATREHDAEYDHAVACYRKRWDNGNARMLEALVPALADEACACTEAACARAAADRLTETAQLLMNEAILDSKQVAMLSRELQRFVGCTARLAPPSPVATIALETSRAICACPDVACASAAAERGNQAMQPYREAHTQLSRTDAALVEAEVHRGAACLQRLSAPAAP